MKHAGAEALGRLSAVLGKLRARPLLQEKRPGVFYLKSRAFMHFHEDPAGLFADVRLGEEFVRLPVASSSEQAALLKRVDRRLAELATDRVRARAHR